MESQHRVSSRLDRARALQAGQPQPGGSPRLPQVPVGAPVAPNPEVPKTLIDRLNHAVKTLPALPTSVSQVIAEARKPEPDLLRIEDFIAADQALAVRVLQIVNSAYYGLSRQVASVSQAVRIIGLQQVQTIALSVGSVSVFTGKYPGGSQLIGPIWGHAFGTMIACQFLAQHARLPVKQCEHLEAAAILHDVGRTLLSLSEPKASLDFQTEARERTVPVEIIERQHLGMDHGVIGSRIVDRWALPAEIVHLIEYHELPEGSPGDVSIAMLNVADAVNKGIYGFEFQYDQVIHPQTLQLLGLTLEDVLVIEAEVRNKLSEAMQIYGVAA